MPMKKNRVLRPNLTATLLLLAVFLICFGLANDEFARVLSKAASICLECIGIG